MCSVFWLFWLSCHYLPIDWLKRLLWGSLIVAMGSSPESPGRKVCKIFLVYCIASLFYYVSCPYVIYYPTAMARYSLFLLKMSLNPKQTNKQTTVRMLYWHLQVNVKKWLTHSVVDAKVVRRAHGASWEISVILPRAGMALAAPMESLDRYVTVLQDTQVNFVTLFLTPTSTLHRQKTKFAALTNVSFITWVVIKMSRLNDSRGDLDLFFECRYWY